MGVQSASAKPRGNAWQSAEQTRWQHGDGEMVAKVHVAQGRWGRGERRVEDTRMDGVAADEATTCEGGRRSSRT